MRNSKKFVLISFVYFFFFSILNGGVRKETLELKELFLTGTIHLYKTPSGLKIRENSLYVLDNYKSTIFSYNINNRTIKFKMNIGKLGQGPGDLNHPFNICFSNKLIGVQDNIAISFFSYSGIFKGKFRIFGFIHDLALNNEMTYILNPDIKSQKMIHQFNKNGKKIRTFGSFFCKLRKENRKNIFWIHKGFLKKDDNSLLYFSKLYGNVIKFSFDGEKKEEKNYLPFIGKNRDILLKINNKLLETGTKKKKGRGFFTGLNILGNIAVTKKYIYLLSLEQYYPNKYLINRKNYKKPSIETVIIKVIDKNQWKLEKEYKVQTEHFYYSAFDVQEINSKAKFFFCYSSINGNSYGYAEETNNI